MGQRPGSFEGPSEESSPEASVRRVVKESSRDSAFRAQSGYRAGLAGEKGHVSPDGGGNNRRCLNGEDGSE